MLTIKFHMKSGQTLTHTIGVSEGTTLQESADALQANFLKLDTINAKDHLTGEHFIIRFDDVSALTIRMF